ncbi:MAG: hypothetical protein HY558_05360 [Euryarchaeota archaeon]|nr:hypothetical protein [Euryarchaeota archaeon]
MADPYYVGWGLFGLVVLAGTLMVFLQGIGGLWTGSLLVTLGLLGYFWVLGKSMVGAWNNFIK